MKGARHATCCSPCCAAHTAGSLAAHTHTHTHTCSHTYTHIHPLTTQTRAHTRTGSLRAADEQQGRVRARAGGPAQGVQGAGGQEQGAGGKTQGEGVGGEAWRGGWAGFEAPRRARRVGRLSVEGRWEEACRRAAGWGGLGVGLCTGAEGWEPGRMSRT